MISSPHATIHLCKIRGSTAINSWADIQCMAQANERLASTLSTSACFRYLFNCTLVTSCGTVASIRFANLASQIQMNRWNLLADKTTYQADASNYGVTVTGIKSAAVKSG